MTRNTIEAKGESAMADDTLEPLERRLAGVLSELEDAEVELTNKEHKIAKQLQEIQGELDRLRSVKAAILGKPPSSAARPYTRSRSQRKESKEKIDAFVSALSNGQKFSARDLSETIDTDMRGVGPILAGMVRRGEVTEAEGESDTGHKLYQRA